MIEYVFYCVCGTILGLGCSPELTNVLCPTCGHSISDEALEQVDRLWNAGCVNEPIDGDRDAFEILPWNWDEEINWDKEARDTTW